jgi:glycosyltransferase involved in cell wall biosynthesis
MHTSTIALMARDLFRKKPVVLSCDGTHLQKRWMRLAYGLKPEQGLVAVAKHRFHRAICSPATGFVAWSNWTRASLIEDYGFQEDAVAVIPPGVNLDWFTPTQGTRELPRILFVGGDFHRKGGNVLLDVFRKRLRGRAELAIVTREPVSEEPGVTVYHDVVANSEKLRNLYASCDIFALPTSADCYSLVCLEALASGLPTVTTRVGGIPDVIIEGETGFLAEPGDAQTVGDALELLVNDPARRAKMSVACRADAARRFEARANARRLFEFVHSRCG